MQLFTKEKTNIKFGKATGHDQAVYKFIMQYNYVDAKSGLLAIHSLDIPNCGSQTNSFTVFCNNLQYSRTCAKDHLHKKTTCI